MNRALTILLFGLFAVQYQSAQQMSPRGMAEERIETLRQMKMIEELGLEQDIAARVVAVNSELRKNNREIFRELDELIDQLEKALAANADEASLNGLVTRIEEKRSGIHANRQEAYTKYNLILTPEQMARLVVFERNFERELRNIMRDAQRDRRRGR
jgi:Spy/CpxP family protein refolding chaperone